MADDGGPAFPSIFDVTAMGDSGPPRYMQSGGMSLRDWFAGQALIAIIHGSVGSQDEDAQNAYAWADAMLAERVKGNAGINNIQVVGGGTIETRRTS